MEQKLYEINADIEQALKDCIDQETGEIKDFSRLEELQIAKKEKVKNIMLKILNMRAYAGDIDELCKKYLAKRKSIKAEIEKLEAYLIFHTQGETYDFPEAKLYYKQSEETVITDIEALEKYCKRHKELGTYEFKPSKTAIKEAIAGGLKVKGAEIVKKQNLQIK